MNALLLVVSVVTKAVYPETEAEAPVFEIEAEAVDPEPRQQGSILTKVTFEK